MVTKHSCKRPRKFVDKIEFYKLCCQKIVIRFSLKRVREEVKSSDSVDLQVTRVEVKILFT